MGRVYKHLSFLKNKKTHTISYRRMLLIALLLFAIAGANPAAAQTDVTDTVVAEDSHAEALVDTTATETLPELPDTITFRQVPDTTVKNLQSKKVFGYANDPAYWMKEKPKVQQDSFFDKLFRALASGVVRWLFFILLFSILAFVIYRIAVVNKLYLFYKPKSLKKEAGGEVMEETIWGDDIDKSIREAVVDKNFRLATRLMYLKGLQQLQEKKLISYNADATNWEYVQQLAKHASANSFRKITRAYEYAWYGEFDITEEQFAQINPLFQQFYSEV